MSKKKIIGGVCAALAVVVVGGYVITSQKGAAQMIVSTETLQQMDLKNTISLTGTVETQTGRKVYSTLTYPVESVNVEVGDVVQEGDVLAKLKTDDLELDIAQQQAAVTASNNQAAHQIEVSRKAYENAKENYENGLDSSAISAEQSVTQAENNVTQSEYSVESAKLQVESAEAAVRDARENYRLTRDQLEGNVTDAEKALDKAEEALSDAKAAYNDAVAGVEGQIAQAEANFAQIKADYDIQKATYDNIAGQLAENVKNAQTAEKEAEDKYNEYKKAWGESSPEAIDAKAKWDDAVEARVQAQQEQLREKEAFQAIEATYNQAQTDLATVKSSIYGQTTSAQSAVASAESGVASAEAQLDAAKDARNGTTLAQVEQGIGSANRGVDSAEVQEDVAKAQLDAAKQSAESAKQQQEATKNAIEQQIDSLQDSLVGSQLAAESNRAQEIAIQKMQNTLEDASITAPVSGVVTAVYAKVGEPGNGLLFVVEDTESLKVKTRIKEYDIANVQVGMPVTIKSDATGDKEISGTITYIAPAAVKSDTGSTQTSSNNSNVEFEAEVQVNDKDSGLRIGMNTRLTVLLEEKQDVFGVAYDSVVKKQDGTDVLYAVEPKSTEGKDASTYIVTEVPVTTGLETDFYIEVSGSNIQNGMSIVSDPQSVTPGMEVTPDFAAAGQTAPVIGLSSESEAQ
ncbi:MAG: HlyD family efflux transporter periplasmic adaptor subunit [Negativibacillus massiliensis]|uniref:HlyD family efflux transporter periplasmic adaptor subunit n=1 Tax=Negativibacillus massiliensis TaxID=1871035 RepID=UPI00399B47FA